MHQEPYATKDKTQLKRYLAQSNGTTYAYDFCDLFKEAITQRWQAVQAAQTVTDLTAPDVPVYCMICVYVYVYVIVVPDET